VNISGKGLVKATSPLEPTQKISYPDLSPLPTVAFKSLTIPEFTPPHKPLSVVKGTKSYFFKV